MKYPFIVAITTAALAGCVTSPYTPPPTQDTRAIGESKLAPKDAAQCIGQKWAQRRR
ncbi:putative periplasmic lipoprotein [Cupriavidus pinatubonensis]|uniref:Lipoprotein n=1 Tax=Cupriavidus pinatubonensis TaxID=248026 RepID=A0ABM8XNM4_9BURK|nr:hypothetical protein [Cupriavidus pinatubonensis]CAG9181823.1 hypothetical protein LMG23994_04761 [Cupriavidus pinatubonensis]